MTDMFGLIDLYLMLLSIREFLENWCTENNTLLRV
jgi:hypothetical protein